MKPSKQEITDLLSTVYQDLNRGGMFSSEDFKLLCHKEPYHIFKTAFENYYLLKKEDQKSTLFVEKEEIINLGGTNFKFKTLKPKLLIEPFNANKITPFSYDLSVGDYYASLRSGHRRGRRLIDEEKGIYQINPRETIIIMSEEYICLPPDYSATIWPKFSFVSEGIFQSMVKIDPTWKGKIAVALTNLSPAKYPIKRGDKFGTLVVYELKQRTSIRLIDESRTIPEVEAEVNINDWSHIEKELKRKKISYDKKTNEDNKARFIIKDYNKTIKDELDQINPNIADSIVYKIIKYLNLEDLNNILEKANKGQRFTLSDTFKKNVSAEDIRSKVLECGGTCLYMPRLLELSKGKIEEEVIPAVQSRVEAELVPKMVQITLAILGFIALITAVLAILLPAMNEKIRNLGFSKFTWTNALLYICIIIGICLLYSSYRLLYIKKAMNFENIRDSQINILEDKLKKIEKRIKRIIIRQRKTRHYNIWNYIKSKIFKKRK